MRLKNFLQAICLLIVFSSCKKEKSAVVFSSINSGTSDNLYTIRKLSGDTLIAGGGKDQTGFVLLSLDNGASWNMMSNGFDQVIYDVYFVNDQIGFACGGTPDVFKTGDGGKTWEKIYIPFPDFPLEYRVPLRRIVFTNDSCAFICGGGQFLKGIIFKTIDQGQTWTLSLFAHELRGILFTNESTGLACGYGAVFKTTDSGNNWNVTEAPNEFYTSIVNSSGQLWMSGYNGGVINRPANNTDWSISNSSNNALSSRNHFNCINATENGTLLASGNDGMIAISYDNGNSWKEGESFDGNTIKSVLLFSENSGIGVGNDGKIFKFTF